MIVAVSDAAEAELEAIGDWIAETNPDASPLVCDGAPAPMRGSLGCAGGVPRYEHLGIRRRPYGNYLIFYRVLNDTVEILHVLHGARDYEAILFPNE